LTASLQALQGPFSSLQHRYTALVASKNTPPPPTPNLTTILNKPPPRQADEPEVIEFEGCTWKWCEKCFGGVWNRTHITSEHQRGKGRSKQRQTPSDTLPPPPTNTPSPQANLAEALPLPQANIANDSGFTLDFL
jgi:hypothetical protein